MEATLESAAPTGAALTAPTPAQVATQQLITLDPAKYVAEVFKPFNDMFAILKAEADTIVPDASTPAGMEIAIKYRAAFRDDVRIAGEKARADRKAPILEIGKLLDTKYKDLVAVVSPYEAKFHDVIKAEEKRKDDMKKAEVARQEAIRLRIVAIRDLPLQAVGKSTAEIGDMITALDASVPDETFGIMQDAAMTAHTEARAKLASVHAATTASEAEAARVAAERAELAQLHAAAAERARLAQEDADRVAAAQQAEADRLAIMAAEQEAAALREREQAANLARQQADAQAEANRVAQAEIDRQRQELLDLQATLAADQARAQLAEVARIAEEHEAAERQRCAAEAAQAAKPAEVTAQPLAVEQAPTTAAPAPTAAVQVRAPLAVATPIRQSEGLPTLRLGQINERIAPLAISADGLKTMGFAPVSEGAAKLYHESQFPLICAALVTHIEAVQVKQAA